MKKLVYKSLLYFVITLLLANAISFLGLKALKNSDFFKTTFLAYHFPSGENFKLVVFGSSRTLASLDTKKIGDELGGTSANFSMDYTTLPSSLLMLKHFYSQGYTADWVTVGVDLVDIEQSKTIVSENDYRFLPFVDEDYINEYYYSYEEGIIKPMYLSRYLPFLGFAYYNMELLGPAIQAAIKPSYRYQFDELGNYEYPQHLSMDSKPPPRYFTTSLPNPLLKEIEALAKANNSKLVFYIAPYLRDDIIIENSPYLVLNHSRIIDEPAHFSDYIHVVTSGKVLATDAFIKDLKDVARESK